MEQFGIIYDSLELPIQTFQLLIPTKTVLFANSKNVTMRCGVNLDDLCGRVFQKIHTSG